MIQHLIRHRPNTPGYIVILYGRKHDVHDAVEVGETFKYRSECIKVIPCASCCLAIHGHHCNRLSIHSSFHSINETAAVSNLFVQIHDLDMPVFPSSLSSSKLSIHLWPIPAFVSSFLSLTHVNYHNQQRKSRGASRRCRTPPADISNFESSAAVYYLTFCSNMATSS